MIQDQESFEAALQRVVDFLEHPGPSPEDQAEFTQLVAEIERYQPVAASAPRDTRFAELGREAEVLMKQAADFQTRMDERERRERWSSFPEDGQGVGPTTGV